MGIALAIAIILAIIGFLCAKRRIKLNENIKELNKELEERNRSLQKTKAELESIVMDTSRKNQNLLFEQNKLQTQIDEGKNHLRTIQETIQETFNNQTELSRKAFNSFWENLEKDYEEKVLEYDKLCEQLAESYSQQQLEFLNDLEKIRATRAAAIEAKRKEQEIKEKLSFYCLTPSKNDLDDVRKLERIKPDLHNSRILSMLIWSTYFQKPMTTLCNNILGTKTVVGIYKITNQINECCYIGQSVDIAKRWKEHAKCGLGIDTPAGNKLYKSMIEDGIWNFSWELLEECSKAELDEKEKFYINLYKSYEYGYNSNAGNGK